MFLLRNTCHFFLCFSCMASAITATAFHSNPSLIFPQEDFKNSDEQMVKGDDFFSAGLYEKALDIYKNLLNADEQKFVEKEDHLKFKMQAHFRLAYTFFLLENFHAASETLDENIKLDPRLLSANLKLIRDHSLYLQALSLKKARQNIPALKAFQVYLNSSASLRPLFNDEAMFETGLIHFQSANYEEASQAFTLLSRGPHKTLNFDIDSEKTKKRLQILSKFYLARIAIQQQNYEKAAELLEPLHSELAINDPLLFEFYYLNGEIAFSLHDYPHASHFFNLALTHSLENNKEYEEALYRLGLSYFKMADEMSKDPVQQKNDFEKAEKTFTQLVHLAPNERSCLALAQCYLSEARELKQPHLYAKAEEILAKEDIYLSEKAKEEVLFLRAEAAPTYALREQFYRILTEEGRNTGTFYAKGWYMRALNDFEYGQELLSQKSVQEAQAVLSASAIKFKKSFELLKERDPHLAGAALKYQALAASDSNFEEGDLKAFKILDEIIWEALPNQAEIYYLHGYFAGRNAKGTEKEKNLSIAYRSLNAAASQADSLFSSLALNLLGGLHYENNEHEKAEAIYLNLAHNYPSSPFAAEAWLWAACCADQLGKELKVGKERRKHAYENYPDSPFAAEAFFTYYTYADYLQGDRTAIKHLQNFMTRYSHSPYLMDAYYLTGLDYKRDRKTAEGKWIRKKNLMEAIDSFQKAEALYEDLNRNHQIPSEKLDYYMAMRYRATLERGMINLAIADEAQGAKRQIYLDYAKEVLSQLSQEFQNKKSQESKKHPNDYSLIEEESSFWLAQALIKANSDEEAAQILSRMLEHYKQTAIENGYYLSRTFEELGQISFRKHHYKEAMALFKKAEEASKGTVLSTDQKLELLIAQSLCCRELGQLDESILILSKVINDDAISALRLKAMFMRAETYELHKRPELARKQLESMAKKGGFWAKKAQEKLDRDYFNHGH